MKRRELLKTGCAATAAGSLVGLGGCIGGDDDGDGSDGGEDGGPTDGDSGGDGETGDGSDGETSDGSDGDGSSDGDSGDTGDEEENTIEELEITGTESELKVGEDLTNEQADRGFLVTATVANNGDETADLMEYGYDLVLYDASGAEIDPLSSSPATFSFGGSEVGSGEEGEIELQINLTKYEPEVADYDLSIHCGTISVETPAYCDDDDFRSRYDEDDRYDEPDWDSAASGSVAENAVAQLEVAELEADRQGGIFFIRPTIRNTGDQTTDLFEYNYESALFETSGAEMPTGSPTLSATSDVEIGPDETGQFQIILNITEHYPEIGSYELTLNCESVFEDETADGVYCN